MEADIPLPQGSADHILISQSVFAWKATPGRNRCQGLASNYCQNQRTGLEAFLDSSTQDWR